MDAKKEITMLVKKLEEIQEVSQEDVRNFVKKILDSVDSITPLVLAETIKNIVFGNDRYLKNILCAIAYESLLVSINKHLIEKSPEGAEISRILEQLSEEELLQLMDKINFSDEEETNPNDLH